MSEWVNWSGSFRRPVNQIKQPRSLVDLQAVVQGVTNTEGRVHAEGSRWAFSAPAYCEDVIIDMKLLNGFPESVQQSIVRPLPQTTHLLLAVEAGIKIHDLYRAIAFDNPPPGDMRGYSGPRPSLPPELMDGRIWTLPVLGGAGGQSLAGAISTGTHGGDAARPPLSDAVHAMLIVSTGGELLLLEPDPGQDPTIIDADRLSSALGQRINVRRDSNLFNAALVSVGRFGVVWAYVIEVLDETGVAIVETRSKSTWEAIRASLVSEVMAAISNDEFLGISINPYPSDEGTHACYITRHTIVPGHPTDPTQLPELIHVSTARQLSLAHAVWQLLGFDEPIAAFRDLIKLLISVGPPLELIVGPYALERLLQIGSIRLNGEPYLTGDAIADILELLTTLGRADVIAILTRRLLDIEQRDQIAGPTLGRWLVKGTRFEIADFYDYNGPTGPAYRGDSVELFFPVTATAPADLSTTIDALLRVFDILRSEGNPVAGYFSLRFMGTTRATLGTARWSPSCSVEIALLRGLRGNERAIRLLQEVCLVRGGLAHWGQRHNVPPDALAAEFGSSLIEWRNQLLSLHGRDMLFSTPFTRERDLEVIDPADWTGWVNLGHLGQGAATLVDGFPGPGSAEVFARDNHGVVQSLRLRVDGMPAGPWFTTRPEPVHGRPTVFRGISGRLEMFVIDDGFLRHSYQEAVGGTTWSGWDTKGYPAPIRYANERSVVAVTAHSDGRLETFGRASDVNEFRLAHCWANERDRAGWTTVWHRGSAVLGTPPSATNRRLPDGRDHLVVVATNTAGKILSMHQVDPADSSGWSDWQSLDPSVLIPNLGGAVIVAPVTGPLHVFTVGANGRVAFAVDMSTEFTPSWGPWTQLDLPVEPNARLAVAVTAHRIWIATHTLRGQIVCWDFAPGTLPTSRVLGGLTLDDVALGSFPSEDAVYIAVRDKESRGLFGRRLDRSP